MRTNRKLFLINVAVFFCLIAQAQIPQPEKSMDEMWGEKSLRKENINAEKSRLFDESNFGMFIHMGLFSHLGGKWNGKTYYGIGEWIMNGRMANIPVNEYKAIAKEYNPKYFDAKKIVKIAKDAGMKYIIITSKHHEGFAMFDSKVDSFNIVTATPYAKDPMKELSAECRRQGLGFGFYYSHNQDWTAPGGTRGPKEYPNGTAATFEDYFYKKCLPQVKEICTNYGQIDFVWFDTPGDMKKELIVELVQTVEKLQPKAMLCSRVGFGYGDYVSQGDMEVPVKNLPGLWETCDTNNDSWSYAWYDTNFKNSKELLNRLVSTVGRGGTYLLNVGPDGLGIVPSIGVKFLEEVGAWLKKYPQVVYKAGNSPWGHAFPWGDVTSNKNSLYLSVFDWPRNGKLYLPGLEGKIERAFLLQDKKTKSITFTKENGWVVLNLPYDAPDFPASVIELRFSIAANTIVADTTLGIAPNMYTDLKMDFATAQNVSKKSIRWMEKFGEWKHCYQASEWQQESKVEWKVNVQNAGLYYVDLSYKGENKLVWKITTDEGEILQNQQAATNKYQKYPMGIIEFKKAGKHIISVSLVEGNSQNSSLESILIKPVNF
jgi:alpha-L-fucosidase